MRIGDKKVFNDHKKLDFLINLRFYGYSIGSLALVFHCDEKAIRLHCDRYFVWPESEPISIARIVRRAMPPPPKPDRPWKTIDGEKVNRGYSYAEYLARL